MTYKVETIANYFIEKDKEYGINDMNGLKLMKIVYIAHGWSLAILNKPLFHEEIQAWKYGPVIPYLYNIIKQHNGKIINTKINSKSENIDSDIQELLLKVYESYGAMDKLKLSEITHNKDTPWHTAWNKANLINGTNISNALMKDYYERLLNGGVEILNSQ